jgi:TatD DNase family protein
MSVDAHCHIDLHPDPQQVVDLAVASNLRVVAVTTTPAAFKGSCRFSDAANGVIPALGMHPELIGTRKKDIALFSKYLDQVTWVGEVGLDGSNRFRASWNDQVFIFKQILEECDRAGGKVLSIHSRAASKEVIAQLRDRPAAGTPVFHWFSGSLTEVELALELGSYFSINDQMLKSKSGVEIARRVPQNRVLTESDAPFAQGEAGQSLNDRIAWCEIRLSELHACSVCEIRNVIDSNFERLTSKYS